MSEAHKKIDLDAALAAWPEVKDVSDARVRSILAKLDTETSSSLSDDELLAAPFAEEPDERQRERESFRAIARLAPSLTPSAPVVVAAKELDSGIVDLAAAAAADPGAEERARTTALANDDLFEETPRSRHPISMGPMPSSVPSIPIVALSSHRLIDDLAPPSTRARPEPKRGVPLYLAGGVAMFAAAAAFFLLMKAPAPAPSPTANVTTTTQVPSPAPTPEPAATTTAEPPATVAMAEPAPSAPPPAAKPAVVAARPKTRPVEPGAAASAPTPPAQAPEEAAPPQVPAAGTVGAAGTGDVPQRPSQGAISSAFGPVMTNARACLGSEDAPVRATVVFAGDGSVQSVTLTPSGTADPCIKAALQRAKVTPFAEATFTANTNVRHN